MNNVLQKTKSFVQISETTKYSIYSILSVLGLCIMAQIKIPLWFTPVPVTGQTLAIALIALNLPRKFAVISVCSYLAMGIFGLPVFAQLSATVVGPSFGYLIGMLLATIFVSSIRSKVKNPTLARRLALCYLGSAIIFTSGALGLSLFVGFNSAFALGVIPFLAGDLIKNLIAASLSNSN